MISQKPITVLTIAGFDPCGGAGILVDCAAIRAVGCHPAAAVSVMTIQNNDQFVKAYDNDSNDLLLSIQLILSSLDVKAIKIGAVKTATAIEAICKALEFNMGGKIVMDPVVSSSSGGTFLEESAFKFATENLYPKAYLITPNLSEAAAFTKSKKPLKSVDDMIDAAKQILSLGPQAVLVKGGHLPGETAIDICLEANGTVHRMTPRPKAPYEVRGTGCALSSLIASWTARGLPLLEAIEKSREMLSAAINSAKGTIKEKARMLGNFE